MGTSLTSDNLRINSFLSAHQKKSKDVNNFPADSLHWSNHKYFLYYDMTEY